MASQRTGESNTCKSYVTKIVESMVSCKSFIAIKILPLSSMQYLRILLSLLILSGEDKRWNWHEYEYLPLDNRVMVQPDTSSSSTIHCKKDMTRKADRETLNLSAS